MLIKQDILIDSKIKSQQFKIVNSKLKIINLKQFILDLVKYSTIYIIVCIDITKTLNKKLAKFEISKKLKDLKDVCNNKLIKILLELEREDYAIKFQNNKELTFISLYNFLQNKLIILWQYLDNTLVKDYIKHLVLLVNVFILFVLKSNDKLYLYVDYRNLNAIIIKNRYLLLLITKILDYLCKAKRFIVLDLKNVYYCIYIKRNNK